MKKLFIIIGIFIFLYISIVYILNILLVSPLMDDSYFIDDNYIYTPDYPKTLEYYENSNRDKIKISKEITSHILKLSYNDSIIYFKYFKPDTYANVNEDSVYYGFVKYKYGLDSVFLNLKTLEKSMKDELEKK